MADIKNIISSLSDEEAVSLSNELYEYDKKIHKKIQKLIDMADLSYNEALEYVINDSIVLWAKVHLNWGARKYQRVILEQLRKNKKNVLRLGRRLGKCLPGDVLIPDSVTGEYIKVEELYKRQNANIFSVNNKNNIEYNNTNIIFENGVKPVYKITTKNGREIKATGNHPFYTIEGWVDLDDLVVGDYIGIACNMKHKNPVDIDVNDVKFLAYMIGDGNYSKGNLRFSCSPDNKLVLDEMKLICSRMNCSLKKYDSNSVFDYHIVSNQDLSIKHIKNHNNAKKTINDYGINNQTSHSKIIPDAIFKLSNKYLSIFLSRLYATDGWACLRDRGKFEIGYCTVSKTMATQIQSLLLRFSINSTVREKKVKYNGGVNKAYHVDVINVQDVLNFCEKIGIYSKEEAVNSVLDSAKKVKNLGRKIPIAVNDYLLAEMEHRNISKSDARKATGYKFDNLYKTAMSSSVKKVCEYIGNKELDVLYDNDIIWDEIVKIEFMGDMPTYDLTVPDLHNFVANDFITHNTECMVISILWHAFRQPNKREVDSANAYEILILTPFETQIDLIFDRMNQLIDSSPTLSSMVSRSINHRYEFINGAIIKGLTVGSSSGKGASNTRGQAASYIILDEVDYMGSSEVTNILNILNEDPSRIKICTASTPSGKHEEFYSWCVNASKTFSVSDEDCKNNVFTEFIEKENPKGNGWVCRAA